MKKNPNNNNNNNKPTINPDLLWDGDQKLGVVKKTHNNANNSPTILLTK